MEVPKIWILNQMQEEMNVMQAQVIFESLKVLKTIHVHII